MLSQLAGFIFDCTCITLPTPIVHIDNYCYLYYSTLFIPFTALYFLLHLSFTLKTGHFENKPFIHSFIHINKLVGTGNSLIENTVQDHLLVLDIWNLHIIDISNISVLNVPINECLIISSFSLSCK